MAKKKLVKKKIVKPPLGLRPRWVVDELRMNEISEAITRYMNAGRDIPDEWLEEWQELAERNPDLIGEEC